MTHHIHHDEAVNIALLGDPAVRALVERAKVEERERLAQAIEAEAERRHAEVVAMWTEDDGTSMCDHKPGDACWHRHEDGCGSCGVAAAARIARADSLAAQPAPEAATVEEVALAVHGATRCNCDSGDGDRMIAEELLAAFDVRRKP